MKNIIIAVAVVVSLIALVPALKGPFNRWRTKANDALNAEYVVDNYKAEYVSLYNKRGKVVESINKFNIEKQVAAKHLALAKKKAEAAKEQLKSVGTDDLKAFERSKNFYEVCKTEIENFNVMIRTYTQAVEKLQKSLDLIDTNMAKTKLNVDTLSAKKTMVDTIKTVNKTIADMNGVGETELAVNVEKLDDDIIRETVTLEALGSESGIQHKNMTKEEAKAYIDSLDK